MGTFFKSYIAEIVVTKYYRHTFILALSNKVKQTNGQKVQYTLVMIVEVDHTNKKVHLS